MKCGCNSSLSVSHFPQGIKYFLWRLTSSGEATLIDPTLPVLQVLNLTPGVYTFTLTVADYSLQVDTDTVTVIVKRGVLSVTLCNPDKVNG